MNLFDSFYRGSNAGSAKGSGTGALYQQAADAKNGWGSICGNPGSRISVVTSGCAKGMTGVKSND